MNQRERIQRLKAKIARRKVRAMTRKGENTEKMAGLEKRLANRRAERKGRKAANREGGTAVKSMPPKKGTVAAKEKKVRQTENKIATFMKAAKQVGTSPKRYAEVAEKVTKMKDRLKNRKRAVRQAKK